MSKLSRRSFLASLLAAPFAAKAISVAPAIAKAESGNLVPISKGVYGYAAGPKGLPYIIRESGMFVDASRETFTDCVARFESKI